MLEKLLNKIETGKMFSADYLQNLDEDEVLDLRDESEFEDEWLRVSNRVESAEFTEKENDLIKKICKQAFLKVYDATQSGELSGYISDDFEMISKAMVMGLDDGWLNALILSYANLEFPYGELNSTELSFEDVCVNLLK